MRFIFIPVQTVPLSLLTVKQELCISQTSLMILKTDQDREHYRYASTMHGELCVVTTSMIQLMLRCFVKSYKDSLELVSSLECIYIV